MESNAPLAERLRDLMQRNNLTLATMESCTAGLIASMLTDVEGAGYFIGGAVTYGLSAKHLFGVSPSLVRRCGLVSAEVAASMAERAAAHFHTDCGIGVTGVAGPGPEDGIPPGTAFAAARLPDGRVITQRIRLQADREGAKEGIACEAVRLLVEALQNPCRRVAVGSEAWVG